MSMQERPDDEAANEGLDRLFRKSAEEFEPPYEPVAWQLMSARLDEHDRITVWGRVLRGTLAVTALIVLLSASWYIYKRSAGGEQSAELVSPLVSDNGMLAVPSEGSPLRRMQSAQSSTAERKRSDSTNNLSKSIAVQSQQETAGRQIDDQPMEIKTSQRRRLSWSVVRQQSSSDQAKKMSLSSASALKAMMAPGSSESLKNGSEPALRPATNVKDKTLGRVVTTSRSASEQAGPTAGQAGAVGEVPGYTAINKTTTDGLAGDAALFTSELSRIGPLDALSNRDVMRWPQWSALTIPALALPQAEPAAQKSANPIRERGLSIRVVLSPDLSAVGIKNFTRPGKDYGLLLEYQLSKRFIVQAGVIQSKKIYTATPEQYAWPSDWKWYIKPVGVDGRCSMLDIPINLRYNFLRVPTGSSWFVSSGVTTYIMQQETYDYVYADPTNQWIKYRSFSAKTGRYNFSNLNVSVGYERSIGRRFFWQIEPFLKVPVKEIGYFKINLLSTGAFMSLRYRL